MCNSPVIVLCSLKAAVLGVCLLTISTQDWTQLSLVQGGQGSRGTDIALAGVRGAVLVAGFEGRDAGLRGPWGAAED